MIRAQGVDMFPQTEGLPTWSMAAILALGRLRQEDQELRERERERACKSHQQRGRDCISEAQC